MVVGGKIDVAANCREKTSSNIHCMQRICRNCGFLLRRSQAPKFDGQCADFMETALYSTWQADTGQKGTFNMMKTLCPTCKARGISEMAKRWSSRGFPATCDQCGALSHVAASTSNGIWVGTILSVPGLTIVAVLLNIPMAIGLAVAVVLTVLINVAMWRRAELIPIMYESAAVTKQVNWFLTAIYALLLLLK